MSNNSPQTQEKQGMFGHVPAIGLTAFAFMLVGGAGMIFGNTSGYYSAMIEPYKFVALIVYVIGVTIDLQYSRLDGAQRVGWRLLMDGITQPLFIVAAVASMNDKFALIQTFGSILTIVFPFIVLLTLAPMRPVVDRPKK